MASLFLKCVLYSAFFNNVIYCYWLGLRCPSLAFQNGEIDYRRSSSGYLQFHCYTPYVLVGDAAVNCSNISSHKSTSLPICARTDCDRLPRLLHGNVTLSHKNAVAKAVCQENFSLIGSPMLYCTAIGWNDTLPSCQANSIDQFSRCNFEPHRMEEHCEWVLRPGLYKWRIVASNKNNIGRYPSMDCTYAPHTGGHYLYLEESLSTSLLQDAFAKFVSPLFPATVNVTNVSCLIFYFYSYGPHAGFVKVLINDDVAWTNVGSRINRWSKQVILLQNIPTSFRITIEGTANYGNFSNTAIDELKVVSGDECYIHEDELCSPYDVEPEIKPVTQSDLSSLNSTDTNDPVQLRSVTEAVISTTFNPQNITDSPIIVISSKPDTMVQHSENESQTETIIVSTSSMDSITLTNSTGSYNNDVKISLVPISVATSAGNTASHTTEMRVNETRTKYGTYTTVDEDITRSSTEPVRSSKISTNPAYTNYRGYETEGTEKYPSKYTSITTNALLIASTAIILLSVIALYVFKTRYYRFCCKIKDDYSVRLYSNDNLSDTSSTLGSSLILKPLESL